MGIYARRVRGWLDLFMFRRIRVMGEVFNLSSHNKKMARKGHFS